MFYLVVGCISLFVRFGFDGWLLVVWWFGHICLACYLFAANVLCLVCVVNLGIRCVFCLCWVYCFGFCLGFVVCDLFCFLVSWVWACWLFTCWVFCDPRGLARSLVIGFYERQNFCCFAFWVVLRCLSWGFCGFGFVLSWSILDLFCFFGFVIGSGLVFLGKQCVVCWYKAEFLAIWVLGGFISGVFCCL